MSFRSRLGLEHILRLLAAGTFLVFLVGQSPHLVHHLFEPSQNQADCAFASAGERTQGLTTEVATLIPAPQMVASGFVTDHSIRPGSAPAVFDARAPPAPLS